MTEEDLVEKTIAFIDNETNELSTLEYVEFLESLVEELSTRIELSRQDLERMED